MRILLSIAVLLALASCAYERNQTVWVPFWSGGPGHLALSNFRYDHAAVEAVMSAAPDCSPVAPDAAPLAFNLPFKGTTVIEAAPNTDVCWREMPAGGQWSEWNRAYTALGRSIDLQL